jgi:glycosyltransferase involved in cell wall biosynthesis
MAELRVSALLSVHAGLDPQHLSRALESLVGQSRPVDEVVLVEDGPLTTTHHDVLESLAGTSSVVRVVLPANGGAGAANQAGLLRCSGTWVLKVDGDDISRPERLERQLAHVAESGLDVVGSAMWEFRDTEDNVVSVRTPPLTHEEIARRMRWNNPMNHPTTLYRRDLAVEVGGYAADLRYMQDYDLFARMLAHGARFANLADPLVLFRAGDAVFGRRRSGVMRRCEWQLQRNLREYRLIGPARRYLNFVIRQGARSLPPGLMRRLHRRLFSVPVAQSPST